MGSGEGILARWFCGAEELKIRNQHQDFP